jgi:tRNA dimethylallyltransferase
MATSNGPLLVIVGPTASGKTALAIDIAQKFNGEIVCADSRTIYKDMDIGTAKPSLQEQQAVAHHLINIVTPDQPFSVADYKKAADDAIADIQSRGKLPVLVGGSGLYIDACIYNYSFRPISDPTVRSTFKDATVQELQAELKKRNIPLPENTLNRRYLLRSLEAGRSSNSDKRLRPNTLIIGIAIENDQLEKRSHIRTERMVLDGIIQELQVIKNKYGWDVPAMNAPAYKSFRGVIENNWNIQDAIAMCTKFDLQLAKKQRTWFKRNKSIHWLNDPSKIVELITTFLNK